MESKSWQRIAPVLQLCALSAALTGMLLLVGSAPAAAHGENGVEKAAAEPQVERPAHPETPAEEPRTELKATFWATPPAGR